MTLVPIRRVLTGVPIVVATMAFLHKVGAAEQPNTPTWSTCVQILYNRNLLNYFGFQPLDAIKSKASSIGATVTSSLSDNDVNAAANAARGKDVALVFISADSGEGYITVEGNAGDR
jgi:hypothetical protein